VDRDGLRRLTQREINMATIYFDSKINYASVEIVENSASQDKGGFTPFSNTIYMGPGVFKADYSAESLNLQSLYIHELTHIWQGQRSFFPPIITGAVPFISRIWTDPYRYTLNCTYSLKDYNIEQQAAIVEDYHRILNDSDPRFLIEKYVPRHDFIKYTLMVDSIKK
jgi:hypothetical protein